MAEEKAASTESAATESGNSSGSKPYLLIGLVVVNMLVVVLVGFMVWKGRQIEEDKRPIIIDPTDINKPEEQVKPDDIGKVIPLETFIVNLAGTKGRRVLKVNMELEVRGQEVIQEIDNRKAQIRDFIIIILSSKSYEEVSSAEGKDALRSEIKDNINSFLSKGKIVNVYFTELLYN
ncbi:flagellar basal body-associated FliL family protein [Pseudobdellovibrio exovorus]|uniref:Flagellar protein FliL n=1 Tax=Pseudobdellovibrio exovorus JSS TaxID=1184267 RepID=M4V9W9_9BACT|nr:flagellar basal body-associated FliL family protein [Pseudobdellovibrio exovorus]AGH94826.1 flagellar protein FliL [Pseudobdellovibrio exovorus JSS]